MKTETLDKIDNIFKKFPDLRGVGATDAQIRDAESQISCRFHVDYIEFLTIYGCGIVGRKSIFGIGMIEDMGVGETVVEQTVWYRGDGWPGVEYWYVISSDGYGNPIGIRPDGAVMISDHDHGGVDKLADGFEEFIVKWCLKA